MKECDIILPYNDKLKDIIGYIGRDNIILVNNNKHELVGIDSFLNRIVNINNSNDIHVLKNSIKLEIEYYKNIMNNYIYDNLLIDTYEQEIYNNLVLKEYILKILNESNNEIELLNNIKKFINMKSDFYVQVLGYDKIEKLYKTITTSKINYINYYYNYLIMDYKICKINKYVLKKETFVEISNLKTNNELEEEIKLIKEKIPYQKRYIYFK